MVDGPIKMRIQKMKKTLLSIALLSVAFATMAQTPQTLDPNSKTKFTKVVDGKVVVDYENVRKEFTDKVDKPDEELITKDIVKKRDQALSEIQQLKGIELPTIEKKSELKVDKIKPLPPQTIPDMEKVKQKNHIPTDKPYQGFDLEKMMTQYHEASQPQKPDISDSDQFEFVSGRAYLFVSASIPKEVMKNLLEEAGRLGVVVLFNGVIGENPLHFKETQAYLTGLKLRNYVDVKIHPPAFEKFKITQVPAVVVASENVDARLDEQGCADPRDYDILKGDIKVGWSVEKIYTDSRSDEIKAVAERYMKAINTYKSESKS